MESQSGNVDDAVARARELVRDKRYEPAISLLHAYLRTHPEDPVAWRRLAGALIGAGDHAAAVDAAGRAIEVSPEDVAAHRHRALAHSLLARHRASYSDAKRAVELAPDDHEALALLAVNVLHVDRDVARFKELFRRALAVNSSSAPARYLAEQHRRIRRNSMAVAVWLAATPAGVALLVRWFAVDDAPRDAGWIMWPGLVSVAVGFVSLLVARSARNAPLMLTRPQVSIAMGVAGVIAAGAGYAGTHAAAAAAVLGMASVAVSGFFWRYLLRPRF
ncbi:tetratricopeptide repeat protein [Micromonospora sp. NPDC004336]